MISIEFLYRLEDEVNRARHEINEKHMGLADIKARLAHIAGIENLTVEQAQGKEIYHLGEQTVEIPSSNAGHFNRVRFLAEGLKALAKVDEAVAAIQKTDTTQPETRRMSITGIEPGIFEAKMAEMKKKLADRLNGGLAKIDTAAEAGAVKMEAAVDGIVAKVDKEIDDKLQEFAQLTNGGPA